MLTILEFHNISRHGVGWTNVPPVRFAQILDLLSANSTIISPRQYGQPHLANRSPETLTMISFDDGYEEIYTRAFPLMKERGIAGMVSIVAGYSGRTNLWDIGGGSLRHLDWREIDTLLTSGWSICSHTMTHPDLKRCTDDRLEWELAESKNILEHKLGIPMPAIAYPFGRFNSRVISATRKAGYELGFTVGAEKWRGVRTPLTIRRVPVYSIDTDAMILAKIRPPSLLKRLDGSKNRFFNKLSLLTSFVHRHRFKGLPANPPDKLV